MCHFWYGWKRFVTKVHVLNLLFLELILACLAIVLHSACQCIWFFQFFSLEIYSTFWGYLPTPRNVFVLLHDHRVFLDLLNFFWIGMYLLWTSNLMLLCNLSATYNHFILLPGLLDILEKIISFYAVPDFEAKRYWTVGLGVFLLSFGGLFSVLHGCWIWVYCT